MLAQLPTAPTLSAGTHYYPVIDGYVVPDDPAVLVGTTSQVKVPLLIGHNADEGLFWASDAPRTISEYRDFVRATFPAERRRRRADEVSSDDRLRGRGGRAAHVR